LGKIPVKYNSSMGKTIFYKQYFEEMLFNYMDALNTFYVATTRAVEHLYITAPSFKQEVDKKTGEVKGYEVKNDYISDLLYQVLAEEQNPFPMENGLVLIDQPLAATLTTQEEDNGHANEQRVQQSTITLTNYPVSTQLQDAFDKSAKRTVNSILLLEKAAQYGVLAHEIMSQLSTEEEINTLVDQYIEEGVLDTEDRPFILKEIQQIWQHPQINGWLTGDYKIWNEAAIILENGDTIRPDKVFTRADETIVLDFKFTKGDDVEHKWQVDNYRKALQNLGYVNVKGYLYYAKINELIAVV